VPSKVQKSTKKPVDIANLSQSVTIFPYNLWGNSRVLRQTPADLLLFPSPRALFAICFVLIGTGLRKKCRIQRIGYLSQTEFLSGRSRSVDVKPAVDPSLTRYRLSSVPDDESFAKLCCDAKDSLTFECGDIENDALQ